MTVETSEKSGDETSFNGEQPFAFGCGVALGELLFTSGLGRLSCLSLENEAGKKERVRRGQNG